MIYDEQSVNETFDNIRKNIVSASPVAYEMPSYMNGKNWTDEYRERDGYFKQADGAWVKFVDVDVLLERMQKSVVDLLNTHKETNNRLTLAHRKLHEMEYGLRVAEKALKKSLDLTLESINDY